jgi:thiamine pyrophosphokinase
MDSTSPLALIFTGGARPHHLIAQDINSPQLVIAADSGWAHARAFGYVPQFLVGDLDSISADDFAEAHSLDTEIVQHSVDKDLTDTEIAVQLARSLKYERIHVVSGGGDRFDHLVAMLHSLVAHTEDVVVTAHIGPSVIHFVTPKERFHTTCAPNTTVSLIPLGGSARGVRSEGLKWNLSRETLHSFASRGVSNCTTSDSFSLALRTGVLAVIITQLTGETS